jgi:hypothetical protein
MMTFVMDERGKIIDFTASLQPGIDETRFKKASI